MQILLLMYKTGLIFIVPPGEIPRWFFKEQKFYSLHTNVATPYSDLNLILSFHTDIHRLHGLDRFCNSLQFACVCSRKRRLMEFG